MNMLFAHDHIFIIDSSGNIYSPGKLNSKSFSRYLEHFDTVTIISRFRMLNANESIDNYNLIKHPHIKFIPFANQSTVKNRFLLRKKNLNTTIDIVEKFDAITVRVPSEIGFLVAMAARKLNKRYVCEVVACPSDAMSSLKSIKSKIYLPIIVLTMKKSIEYAAGAIYVTDKILQQRYPCSGFVENASNVEIEEVIAKNNYYDISKKTQVNIVLTGNLDSHHKGYETLYKLLDKLNENNSKKFTFILIGPGRFYRKKIIFKNVKVEYTGALKKESILKLLDDADLYIQPSTQEGLPRATIEAMSRGLPCVVSDAGGLPELVDTTCVFSKNNVDDFYDKITMLLSDNEIYWSQSRLNNNKALRFLNTTLAKKRFFFFDKYKISLLKK